MGRFTGQVVFVTGGSSGIGAEACQLFINEGAKVFVADLEERNITQRLGSEHARYMRCDVSQQQDCEAAIQACLEKHGRLDVLFANAGILHPYNTVPDQPVDVFHRVMEINLHGLFYLAKAAIPLMRKQGKGVIVATSSTSGLGGDHGNSAYCVSKAGVVNLCRVMALDHAKDNIRVNAVCPGYVSLKHYHDGRFSYLTRPTFLLFRTDDVLSHPHILIFLSHCRFSRR